MIGEVKLKGREGTEGRGRGRGINAAYQMESMYGITFFIVAAVLLAMPTHVAGQALDASRLSIFATDPVEVNWPVLMTAYYADPAIDITDLVFQWTFEGGSQTCNLRGRANSNPCRNRAVEKTWARAGNYRVTVTVSYAGGPSISADRVISVQNFVTGPVVQRREIRTLSRSQWNETVQALWELKRNGIYDHLVYVHQVTGFTGLRAGTMRSAAHRGPAFLPWHRIYMRLLERALQVASGNAFFGLPYWDWTIDQALPRGPLSSALWTNAWFGPSGDAGYNFAVRTGPFCSTASPTCPGVWRLLPQLSGPNLERELGRLSSVLPTAWQINNVRSVPAYDANPYNEFTAAASSFRQALEGWSGGTTYGTAHNGVHLFIGGSMGPMTSPNDPVFFFHHCNTDRIWYQWQVQQGCYANCWAPQNQDRTVTQGTAGSVYTNGQWRLPGHHWGDAMYPWSLRPADVADNGNSLKGYYYA